MQFQKEIQYKRLITWTVISVVFFVISLFTLEKTVHADLISFVSSFFGSERASAKINQTASLLNSQTISLLQAHVNVNPVPDVLSDTAPIADNETLVADLATIDANDEDTSNTQISTYTIQQGDTISGVAKMFHVSMNTILWANDLTSRSTLKSGQTLIILPVTGISYTVKKNDTVQSIAKKYKADVTDIYGYNDLSPESILPIGQTIIIPDAEMPAAAPSRATFKSVPARNIGGPDLAGYYLRPLVGGIKTQGLHGNNAVDLAGPVGTPIRAAAAGIVIISVTGGWHGGYGNHIIISHPNGTQTLYAHTSKNLVHAGEVVEQGQNIALIGLTGHTTGPHLHFEIRGARNPF